MSRKEAHSFRVRELERRQRTYSREIATAHALLGDNAEEFVWVTINLVKDEKAGAVLAVIKQRVRGAGLPLLRYIGVRVHRNRRDRLAPHMHLLIEATEPEADVIRGALETIGSGGRKKVDRGPRATQMKRCRPGEDSISKLCAYMIANIRDHRDVLLLDGETQKHVDKVLGELRSAKSPRRPVDTELAAPLASVEHEAPPGSLVVPPLPPVLVHPQVREDASVCVEAAGHTHPHTDQANPTASIASRPGTLKGLLDRQDVRERAIDFGTRIRTTQPGIPLSDLIKKVRRGLVLVFGGEISEESILAQTGDSELHMIWKAANQISSQATS